MIDANELSYRALRGWRISPKAKTLAVRGGFCANRWSRNCLTVRSKPVVAGIFGHLLGGRRVKQHIQHIFSSLHIHQIKGGQAAIRGGYAAEA